MENDSSLSIIEERKTHEKKLQKEEGGLGKGNERIVIKRS